MGTTQATKKRKIRRRKPRSEKRAVITTMPNPLVMAVKELDLGEAMERGVFTLLENLMSYSYRETGRMDSPMRFCSQLFPNNYNLWIDEIIDAKILFKKASSIAGRCDRYRVNSDLLTSESFEKVSTSFDIPHKTVQNPIYKGYMRSFESLDIPLEALMQKSKDIANGITLHDYLTNDHIPIGRYEINYGKAKSKNGKWIWPKSGWAYSKTIVENAKDDGHFVMLKKPDDLEFMSDLKLNYTESPHHFIELQKGFSRQYNEASIKKLINRSPEFKRNLTNNRLDNPFSNLSRELWKIIVDSNNLRELDAANSQYALLANKMGKQVDEPFYNAAARYGKLYEALARRINPNISFHLGKGTPEQFAAGKVARNKAKGLCMVLAFGPANADVPYVDVFQKLYPNAYDWINWYKLENPENIKSGSMTTEKDNYKALSISLQIMESDFWVDGVLAECYDNNILAISRHDSISVYAKDRDEVYDIIKEKKREYGYDFRVPLNPPL